MLSLRCLFNRLSRLFFFFGDKVISKQEHESNVIELLTFLTKEIRSLREENVVLHDLILNLSNDVGTLQQQLGGKPKTTAARINSTNNNTNNNNVIVEEKEDKDQQAMIQDVEEKKEEEKKGKEKKKREPTCVHCKKWTHKIDNCWRKHPEIAPSEWKKKAEELKKQAEERGRPVSTVPVTI